MKKFIALGLTALFCIVPWVSAEEPDHAIHEELRGVLREVQSAINSGQYDRMLPYLTPDVEATSVTQEVMSSRADVSKYFQTWFGPAGYMRKMTMTLDADKLTELSPDKRFGLELLLLVTLPVSSPGLGERLVIAGQSFAERT